MKRDLTSSIFDELFSAPPPPRPTKNYETNQTKFKSSDDTWSLELLGKNDWSPRKKRLRNEFFSVVIDNNRNFEWIFLLKNKYAQSITDAFSQIIKTWKRQPTLLETDDGTQNLNKSFNDSLNNKNDKIGSRDTSLGAVFAECYNKSIRNLLKKPVFEKGNSDWRFDLPSVTEIYFNTHYSSTKMTPIQVSIKNNEEIVFKNLQDRRKKHKPQFHLGQLFRTVDTEKVFSNSECTNWSYIIYTLVEVINDTILSYRNKIINQKKNNETSLRSTNITLYENNQVMEKLKKIQ